jgi:indole-3-glycerol phosphate synthase
VPKGVTLVAESGLHSGADVQRMGKSGAHAVLVGESLVKAENMAEHVRTFSTQKRSQA